MPDGFDNVACTSLTLGPDHGRAFIDPAERLTEITSTADEGDLELFLVDMVLLVCRCQDLALVNHVHAKDFQDLGLDEVTDPDLAHDRDRDRLYDLEDLLGVGHAGYTSRFPDIGRHALKRHDCDCPGFLGDLRLFGIHYIHNDAPLLHGCKAALEKSSAKSQFFQFHARPPEPAKERSFEMRLGMFWLVRIGIVMLLTGLVFFGNYAYQNFIVKMVRRKRFPYSISPAPPCWAPARGGSVRPPKNR